MVDPTPEQVAELIEQLKRIYFEGGRGYMTAGAAAAALISQRSQIARLQDKPEQAPKEPK